MSEIKVGDYIRTDYGEIHRVVEIVEDVQGMNYYKYENKMGDFEICIKKTSSNIIDLIEIGDFIDGIEITNIEKVKNTTYIEFGNTGLYSTTIINDKYIETILTHEQYEKNCFKVVE